MIWSSDDEGYNNVGCGVTDTDWGATSLALGKVELLLVELT